MKLRYYQEDAIANVERALSRTRSTLVQLPTGCGKTLMFNDIARRYAESMRRTLILAHREELIFQAASALERATGIKAAIEKAERAEAHEVLPTLLEQGAPGVGPDGKPLVVVASVQSMVRRLDKFKPDHFDLVVIDECHHAPAKTYRDIIDHFAPAKVLGVSATPERSDQVALGSIFDDVAFRYEIADGIEDGWLVPIHQQVVKTEHLDLSKVRTTAGDLNLGDLEAAMTQTDLLHEIAGPAVELSGDRQGIVFAVTVEHAYLLAEAMREQIVDRWRKLGRGTPPQNIVVALDGTTDVDERRETLEAFRRGEIQFLLNCALFVEGTDLPSVGVVVMAAPTKSRARYTQMIGRGTRPLPGIVDAFPGRDEAAHRRSAIALSEKTHTLVIDFTENSGKHKLISATDLLAGKYSEPELALAKSMLARHEVKDILEALRRARAKIKEMEALRAQARKGFQTATVDPFDPLDLLGTKSGQGGPPLSEKQRAALKAYGVENVDRLDAVEAQALLKTVAERKAANLADFNQVRTLMRRGGVRSDRAVGLTFVEAAEYIAKLAKNGWRRPPSWDIKFGPAEAPPKRA